MASLMDAAEELNRKNQVIPLTNEFDESKSTEGRVAGIVDANSPLMQRARVQGTQMAAQRGLVNTTLAGEAEQNAVLDKAVPIAQTDAGLYSQNSLANLAAKNQAAVVNANNGVQAGTTALGLQNSNDQQDKTLAQQDRQFGVQAGQAQQQIDAQIDQFAKSMGMTVEDLKIKRDTLNAQQSQYLAGLENQRAIANLNSETQKAIANLSSDTQLQIAKLEQANKDDIQGSVNIGNAWSQTMSSIANIQNNPNLEESAKRTLIQNNIDSFQSFAAFWKKNSGTDAPDISDLLNFNMANATAPTINPATPGYNPPNAPPGYDPFDGPGGAGGG